MTMERIQAAIAKAKEKRETGAGPSPGPSAARPKVYPHREAGGPRPAGPIWAELAGFEPEPSLMRRNRIVTFERSDPVHATFDMMRTKTLRLMREKGWKTLGVTSPTTGCGKTTMLANLAFSFAHQPDMRIVVMDVDLRRPALGRLLGLAQPQSMASVLQGTRGLAENFVRYGDNLAIGTNSKGIRNSSELLQHPSTGHALAELKTQFRPDLVLVDLPPMLVNDDVMAFMPHLDAVLLVAAAERSRIDEIDKCEQDLAEHANVLGVVLNKCRYPGEDYGYY
jgi:Mrp family chromosome partitioning ATPase